MLHLRFQVRLCTDGLENRTHRSVFLLELQSTWPSDQMFCFFVVSCLILKLTNKFVHLRMRERQLTEFRFWRRRAQVGVFEGFVFVQISMFCLNN